MDRPRLLDLFCGAGGCSMGYHRAGFDVTGVDINPQPRYPFTFIQADVMTLDPEFIRSFDAVHASPPCQAYSMASQQWRKAGKVYPDLLGPVRGMLIETGKHYVIENVPGADLINPTKLTGALFGLRVRRTRYFETSFDIPLILVPSESKSNFKMGRPIVEGDIITPVGHFSGVAYAKKQMDIDWMTQKELSQAIPPAYTEFIGKQLMDYLRSKP